MTHPLVQFLARPRVRIGLGATTAVALAAIVALGAFTAGGETAPRPSGPGLAVAVVPPVERIVDPGGTMDVGALSDGFDRAVLERRPVITDDTYLPPEAHVGDDGFYEVRRMPMPTAVAEPPPLPVEPVRDALDDGSRSFGFDGPRPDYAAERAEREAARSATPPTSELVKYSSE